MSDQSRQETRQRRHQRLRQRVCGTALKPRLSVYRSEKHIYAQLIDDVTASTFVSASSLEQKKPVKKKGTTVKNKAKKKEDPGTVPDGIIAEKEKPDSIKSLQVAKEVGKLVAQRALEKGISQVVFDRGGFQFHGRVKAVADGAREAGLKF